MTYHLRRADREIKDDNELKAIIANCRYAVIGLSKDDTPMWLP